MQVRIPEWILAFVYRLVGSTLHFKTSSPPHDIDGMPGNLESLIMPGKTVEQNGQPSWVIYSLGGFHHFGFLCELFDYFVKVFDHTPSCYI